MKYYQRGIKKGQECEIYAHGTQHIPDKRITISFESSATSYLRIELTPEEAIHIKTILEEQIEKL